MAERIVKFAFDIGDEVAIKGLDAKTSHKSGRVAGLCMQKEGKTYRIVWWMDGKRFDEWMQEWELE